MTGEDMQAKTPTRSRAVNVDIYTARRATFATQPMLALNPDFTINCDKRGPCTLAGPVQREGEDARQFTKLLFRHLNAM
eukprot:6575919-Pyramimonas_sp.AAC.1